MLIYPAFHVLTSTPAQAVLLLRPNVPLYSTDALPVNCSAFSSSPDSTSAPSSSSSAPSSSSPPANPAPFTQPSTLGAERPLTRTCECLTQTLCCHGCGSAVGYMIVSPCHRCTSSITANNRATNGHRFVFYSSEIAAGERYYVAGERGVHPCVLAPASPSVAPRNASPPLSPPAPELALGRVSRGAYPPAEFLPTRRAEDDTEFDALLRLSSPGLADAELRVSATSAAAVPPARPPPHSTSAHNSGASGFVDPAIRPQPPHAQEGLKDGEVLYWHHLVRSGDPGGV
ncbi:hypothetical protein A0H81_12862 [Grifola frondosa]|uniref:Protein FAM72A n=1 Tax=Grifola frondosa TaxID=5627 RepID=A0A1C7LQV1_GRIFR|nr:hypothetical protein A0H81_12862 [Grifola frondosa]